MQKNVKCTECRKIYIYIETLNINAKNPFFQIIAENIFYQLSI